MLITANFDNSESAQAAGGRIRAVDGVTAVDYLLDNAADAAPPSERAADAPCLLAVRARPSAADTVRGIIFNAGGYDCALRKR